MSNEGYLRSMRVIKYRSNGGLSDLGSEMTPVCVEEF